MTSRIVDKVLENKKFLQRVGLYGMSYEIDELSAKEHSLLAKSACESARTLVGSEIRTPALRFVGLLVPQARGQGAHVAVRQELAVHA